MSPPHCFFRRFLSLTEWRRAERKLNQVCSEAEYRKVFARLQMLPQHVEHLVVQLGKSLLHMSAHCLTNRVFAHRYSHCVSSHGLLGDDALVKAEPASVIRAVGVYGTQGLCEQVQCGC